MPGFESKVVRHTDSATPRYRVDFIGDEGDSVSVECSFHADDHEPSREEVVEAARRLVREVAGGGPREGASEPTLASQLAGLSRPLEQTEDRVHTSDGRDFGTE